MLKKTSLILLLGIFLSSCVKRDNDLDCLSENFENNSFLIESATVINPDTIPNPGSYPYTSRGSVDLKLKIKKINNGLEYYIGICWDTSINPAIDNNATYIGSDTKALDGEQYIDNNEVYFQMNCKFIGGGKRFSARESAFGSSGSYNYSYLKPNTIYYFRYFIYISRYDGSATDVGCNPITKYSDNFKIIIP
jgi:hypothetical protein